MSRQTRSVADVSQLPDVTFGVRNPLWWGTLGFMLAEGTTMVVCAFAFLYLRKNFESYPPGNLPLPSLTAPVWQLALMAASIGIMWYAARAARALNLQATRVALTIEIVFKLGILALRWYEFKALGVQWNTNAYGSAAWLVLGFHATLLLFDAAEDIGIAMILWSKDVQAKHFSDVVDDAIYWYFTVAIWVPLFVMIFLYPRWA